MCETMTRREKARDEDRIGCIQIHIMQDRKDQQTDRQTDIETDRQTDRQKDRKTERQTDRQTDRQAEGGRSERVREKEKGRKRKGEKN